MCAVLQGEVRAADAADAWTGTRKFLRVPGALRRAVVASRDHLAVPDDDAAHLSAQAGRTQRGGEGQDHRVGRLIRPCLLLYGMGFDRVRIGCGPASTTRRWPGGPGRHRSMLTCLENPGDRGPAMRAGADSRPVSRPQRRRAGAQVDGAMALVAEGQLGWGAVRVGDRRSGEAQ